MDRLSVSTHHHRGTNCRHGSDTNRVGYARDDYTCYIAPRVLLGAHRAAAKLIATTRHGSVLVTLTFVSVISHGNRRNPCPI